jgi:hypothetical protein
MWWLLLTCWCYHVMNNNYVMKHSKVAPLMWWTNYVMSQCDECCFTIILLSYVVSLWTIEQNHSSFIIEHWFIHWFIHASIHPSIHWSMNTHTHSHLLLENSIQSKKHANIDHLFNPPKLPQHPIVHLCIAYNSSSLGTFLDDGQRSCSRETTRCYHCL